MLLIEQFATILRRVPSNCRRMPAPSILTPHPGGDQLLAQFVQLGARLRFCLDIAVNILLQDIQRDSPAQESHVVEFTNIEGGAQFGFGPQP